MQMSNEYWKVAFWVIVVVSAVILASHFNVLWIPLIFILGWYVGEYIHNENTKSRL